MNKNLFLFAVLFLASLFQSCSFTSETKNRENSQWSKAEIVSLCDSADGHSVDYRLVSDHEGKIYYNKQVQKSKHEISINFDFISDCCLEFELSYKIEKDILILTYTALNDDYCDCKCNYRGTLNVKDDEMDFGEIFRVKIIKRN